MLFCAILSYVGGVPAIVEAKIWDNVNVISASGWEYTNISVEANAGESFVMMINPDGGRKKLSKSNIRLILDHRGKDITAAVFGGLKQPEEPSEKTPVLPDTLTNPDMTADKPSGILSDYRKVSKRYGPRFSAALSVGPGYSTATGTWFDGINSGMSANICGRIAVFEYFFIALSYSYQKLGVDSDLEGNYMVYDDYGNPLGMISVDFDVHLDEVYFSFGYMSEPADLTKPFIFSQFGFGGVNHNIKITLSDGSTVVSGGMDETKFGMLFSFGAIIPFSANIGLCLEGDMRLTGGGDDNQYDYYDTSSTGILFGAKINLIFLTGK